MFIISARKTSTFRRSILEQIDSDEGHLLVSKFSFSASLPKN